MYIFITIFYYYNIMTLNDSVIALNLIKNVKNLKQISGIWNTLKNSVHSPIEDLSWIQSCAEEFWADGKLRILIAQQGDQSISLAPLVKRSFKGLFPHLEMLGVRQLLEPMDFLYTDETMLKILVNNLKKLKTPLYLPRIRANSPVIGALHSTYRWVNIKPAGSYPSLILHSNWKEPEKQFNSGRRSDFRRAQRNAEKLGEVSYEILSPTEVEVESLLQEAYQTELKSWKGKNGTALAIHPFFGKFFRQYGRIASHKGIFRLSFLRINGKAIAMQIAVEYDKRFWLLKIGYNEDFSRCSPGTLLMLHTVKYAATQGLKSYEFLGFAEKWTQLWTQSCRDCVSVSAYPDNIGSIMTMVCDQLLKTYYA